MNGYFSPRSKQDFAKKRVSTQLDDTSLGKIFPGVGSNLNTEKSAILFSRKQSLWKIILKGKHAMT